MITKEIVVNDTTFKVILTDQVINQVKSPVLIMWGKQNKVVPVELAYEMEDLLINSPSVEMTIYESGGHQLVQELGEKTAVDAL